MERLVKQGNRAARTLIEKSPGGASQDEIEAIINANKKLTPAAPVELLVQTSIHMTDKLKQQGTINLTFPPVTKAATGQELLVDKYELWGKDITAAALKDTTAAYPDVTAPGLSYPGQGFYAALPTEPPWMLLASSPDPDLTRAGLKLGSRWVIKARAIGAFTVAPGLWSAEREVMILPDNNPPAQPTKPIITTRLGSIIVEWDGLSVSGPMPSDLLTIHVAQGDGPSPETIVTTFDGSTKIYVVADAPYYSTQFFRFRAEDISGNLSGWSEQEVGVTVPLVDTSEMKEVLRQSSAELAAAKGELEAADASLGDLIDQTVVIANNAQASADGKGDTYYASPADTSVLNVGDTLFDPDNGNRVNRWDGTAWIPVPYGEEALEDLAVTNAKIAFLDAAKITTGYIDVANRIRANSIFADKLVIGRGMSLIDNPGLLTDDPYGTVPGWRETYVSSQSARPDGSMRFSKMSAAESFAKLTAAPYSIKISDGAVDVSASMKMLSSSSGTDVYMLVNFFDSVGAITEGRVNFASGAPGTTVQANGQLTVPIGTVSASVELVAAKQGMAGLIGELQPISVERVFGGTSIAPGSITVTQIADGAVGTTKIEGGAITSDKILANAVVAGKIAADAVVAGNIAALAVTAGTIAANAVTADEIDAGSVRTAILTANSVNASMIKSDAITVKHTITAATFQSVATANRGVKMDASGIRAWTNTGEQTVNISSSTGFASISGMFKSAMPGDPGVVLVPSSQSYDKTTMGVWFTPNVDNLPGIITGGIWTDKLPNNVISTYPLHLRGVNGGGVVAHNGLRVGNIGSLPASIIGDGGLQLSTSGSQAIDVVNASYPYSMMFKTFNAGGSMVGFYENNLHCGLMGFGARFGSHMGIEGLGRGVKIVTHGNYGFYSNAAYGNTVGGSANVVVTSDGQLRRTGSAAKYKLNITDMPVPEGILDVKVRHWYDKGEVESYVELLDRDIGCFTKHEQEHYDAINMRLIPGAVADEVEAAGGEAFVEYGVDGQIEGLMYDRFALARTQLLNDKLEAALRRIEALESQTAG